MAWIFLSRGTTVCFESLGQKSIDIGHAAGGIFQLSFDRDRLRVFRTLLYQDSRFLHSARQRVILIHQAVAIESYDGQLMADVGQRLAVILANREHLLTIVGTLLGEFVQIAKECNHIMIVRKIKAFDLASELVQIRLTGIRFFTQRLSPPFN